MRAVASAVVVTIAAAVVAKANVVALPLFTWIFVILWDIHLRNVPGFVFGVSVGVGGKGNIGIGWCWCVGVSVCAIARATVPVTYLVGRVLLITCFSIRSSKPRF